MSAMDMERHGSGMSAQQDWGKAMHGAHAAMMSPAVWTPAYAGLMFVMWWVMMVAMMLPSASPMILLFARIQRSQQAKGAPLSLRASLPPGIWSCGVASVSWRQVRNGGWNAPDSVRQCCRALAGSLGVFFSSRQGSISSPHSSMRVSGTAAVRSNLSRITGARASLGHCGWASHTGRSAWGAVGCSWAPVRGRRHESLLDYWSRGLCATGKNDSCWTLAGGATGIGLIVWGGWLLAGTLL